MSKVTVINGVGPGNGAHFAHRFAGEGHAVALVSRTADYLETLAGEIAAAGGKALPVAADLTDPGGVAAAFARIREELGEVDTLIQNAAGGAPRGPFLDIEPERFLDGFRITVMGAVYAAREVVPGMVKKGAGNIVVIGATASLRGGNGFSAFAVGKFGQRALAQSLAREFGPQGIHVSHVIIDGVINNPRSRGRLADRPDGFFLQPQDIAQAVWELANQPRSAWSHEIDLRPFGEKW